MSSETINREASNVSKGFRLQKIRAIKLMMDSISNNVDSVFFTAVENLEDVSHQTVKDDQETDYFEEDKNYDEKGSFTIFSPQIKNTLVSFFDIYIDNFRSSKQVYLGFYTTCSIGKERKKVLTDGTELTIPIEPILSLLEQDSQLSDETLEIVKLILIEEYTLQYGGKAGKGHLETLKNQTLTKFAEFLEQTKWCFGQEDEVKLKETVLKMIEDSPLHNSTHIGKESIIFGLLMEKLDEKQNKSSLLEKLIHSSDVKLIFKEVESEIPERSMDPTWMQMAELEAEITDKRNLKEKIVSTINNYPENKIKHFARKACRSKAEQSASNKTFLSLKYRVLEACNDYFFDGEYSEPKDKDELDAVIQHLFSNAIEALEELKKDYQYTISNKVIIEGIVLDLFDSCYLAFEENDNAE